MTLEQNKQWLHEALYSYTEAKFTDRFKGILLDRMAAMKMGTVFGFLATHEELIQNFFDQLEFLNRHELVGSSRGERYTTPNKYTKLCDDGSLFSFGFVFMILATEDKPIQSEQLGLWKDKYYFGMNGGLIFHGLGNQNFTVTLSQEKGPYWSINT